MDRGERRVRLRRGTEHPLLAWGLPCVAARGAGTALVALPGRYDALAGVDTCTSPRIKTPGLTLAVTPSVVAAAAVAVLLLLARLLPLARLLLLDSGRWGATRGAVEGSEKGRSGADLVLVLETQLLEEELVPGNSKSERFLGGDVVGDGLVLLVEAAEQVEDEVGLGDGLPDVAKIVGSLLHAHAVLVDGGVALGHRVELVTQEDGAGRLVSLVQVGDGRPELAGGLLGAGHSEVEDGVGDGAEDPTADAEVSLHPCIIGGRRGDDVKVREQPEFATHGVESCGPLGVVGGSQLEGHGDVGLDVYHSIWANGWVYGFSHGWRGGGGGGGFCGHDGAAVWRRSKVGRHSGRERRRFGGGEGGPRSDCSDYHVEDDVGAISHTLNGRGAPLL